MPITHTTAREVPAPITDLQLFPLPPVVDVLSDGVVVSSAEVVVAVVSVVLVVSVVVSMGCGSSPSHLA